MQVVAAGQTDTGRVRDHNEDAFVVEDGLGLFVVADGMGGHAGGETASRLAVQSIVASVHSQLELLFAWEQHPQGESPQASILAKAVQKSCADVNCAAQVDPNLSGMGTTVAAAWVREGRATIANVGDSRVYLCRDAYVMLLTDDHSLVCEQMKAGVMSLEEAKNSRLKNIITRSVGFEADVAVDCYVLEPKPGDRLLICSDGMSNFVDLPEVGRVMHGFELDQVPEKLIELANERGGDDNITVICIGVQ